MGPCGCGQLHNIVTDRSTHGYLADLTHSCHQFRTADDRFQRFQRLCLPVGPEHLSLCRLGRITQSQPHEETIQLCFRQRERSLNLYGILRSEDKEGRFELVRDAVHRNLPLLHALQE